MPSGINLHALVRPMINRLHPDLAAMLHQSAGQSADAEGRLRPRHAPGLPVMVQMQSHGPTELAHADTLGLEQVERRFYLFSRPEPERRVAGIARPLARGGDLLHLEDNTWWLVTAVLEDFSRAGGPQTGAARPPGWVAVRATLQVEPPENGAGAP